MDLGRVHGAHRVGWESDHGDQVVGARQVVVADRARGRGREPVGQPVRGKLVQQRRQRRRHVDLTGLGDVVEAERHRGVRSRGGDAQHGHDPAVDPVLLHPPQQRVAGPLERPGVADGVLPGGVALLGPDGRIGRRRQQQERGTQGDPDRREHEPYGALSSTADDEAGSEPDHPTTAGAAHRPSRTTTSRSL